MRGAGLDSVVGYLQREIPKMKPHTVLFKTLKRELGAIGRWRNLPRGKPEIGNFSPTQRPTKSDSMDF